MLSAFTSCFWRGTITHRPVNGMTVWGAQYTAEPPPTSHLAVAAFLMIGLTPIIILICPAVAQSHDRDHVLDRRVVAMAFGLLAARSEL